MTAPTQAPPLNLEPIWSALGEIDFIARALIEIDKTDGFAEAGPTLRRACFVRLIDAVQLATLSLEGHDTEEAVERLCGVTV